MRVHVHRLHTRTLWVKVKVGERVYVKKIGQGYPSRWKILLEDDLPIDTLGVRHGDYILKVGRYNVQTLMHGKMVKTLKQAPTPFYMKVIRRYCEIEENW